MIQVDESLVEVYLDGMRQIKNIDYIIRNNNICFKSFILQHTKVDITSEFYYDSFYTKKRQRVFRFDIKEKCWR